MANYLIYQKNEIATFEQHFLALPKMLYASNVCMQDIEQETSLLRGTHVLNKYFTFIPLIIMRDTTIVARAVVTLYDEDEVAYLGFFESIDDKKCVQVLLDKVLDIAKVAAKKKIVGPVNASFWLGYRLKVNKFEMTSSPYSMEPYNLAYYPKLWHEMGFTPCESYISSVHIDTNKQQYLEKPQQEQTVQINKATYHIVSPKRANWRQGVADIYKLVIELYEPFPIFKSITAADFAVLFENLKYIVDFSMLKIAYLEGKAVGFFITIPDYGNNLTKKMTIKQIITLLIQKKRAKRYIMMYIGVEQAHIGVGKTMIAAISHAVRYKKGEAIGALRREKTQEAKNKPTEAYTAYRYMLYEKVIKTH